MNKTQLPSNFLKHTTSNPLQKMLITNFYNTFFTMVKPLSVQNILDTGCGEGFTLQKLHEKRIGKHLEGIDFSEQAIAIGKKQFPSLALKTGSIYKLPYKPNTFDLVTCMEVLEHLENPEKGLQEIIRVSRRYVLFSVPHEPFFMLSNFVRGKYFTRFGNHPEHIQHWHALSFSSLLRSHNITPIKTSYPFPWIMVLGEKTKWDQ